MGISKSNISRGFFFLIYGYNTFNHVNIWLINSLVFLDERILMTGGRLDTKKLLCRIYSSVFMEFNKRKEKATVSSIK